MKPAVTASLGNARARAVAWLTAWDSHGPHRTATRGDEAGALWLTDQVASLGFDVAREVFALDRLDPIACCLELDGQRISAVPVFDAPYTGAGGVTGKLSLDGRDEAILTAELEPRSVYTGEYEALRRGTSHRALVVIYTGAHPGMGLLNAERFRDPYGAPAIHVSSVARETVLAGAARAAPVRVVVDNRYVPTIASNVVVAIRGRSRSSRRLPRLVVMTPRSSWWQSTAERGGGLVCWLEPLRALIAAPPACDLIFTANSGHELGHLGLDDFIARRPGWEGPVGATWVHFGANIGAAQGELSLQSASDDLRKLSTAELARAAQAPAAIAPKTLVPSGETRDIHRAGGRYVTLVGSNPLFHLPQDRWPQAVDADRVTRVAAAAAALVVALTRG